MKTKSRISSPNTANVKLVKTEVARHQALGSKLSDAGKLTLDEVIVTEQGTESKLPIVDFVLRDGKGNQFVFTTTGRIVTAIARLAKEELPKLGELWPSAANIRLVPGNVAPRFADAEGVALTEVILTEQGPIDFVFQDGNNKQFIFITATRIVTEIGNVIVGVNQKNHGKEYP